MDSEFNELAMNLLNLSQDLLEEFAKLHPPPRKNGGPKTLVISTPYHHPND